MSTTMQFWKDLQLPELSGTGYRVTYPNICTTYSELDHFKALGYWSEQPSDTVFRDAVVNHMNWRCEVPSPFISVMLDKKHALNCARLWSKNHDGVACEVVVIEVGNLETVYSLGTLVKELNIFTWLRPDQYERELLVLHEVPGGAILSEREVSPARHSNHL